MKPAKNPHKLPATRRKAGPHQDGARRPDEKCNIDGYDRRCTVCDSPWWSLYCDDDAACSGEEGGDGIR